MLPEGSKAVAALAPGPEDAEKQKDGPGNLASPTHGPKTISFPAGHHGRRASVDDILDKAGNWLERLAGALTQIAGELAGARSFSVPAGTNVSVTEDFGPAGGSAGAGG